MTKQLHFDIEADEIQIFTQEVDELLQSMESGTLSLETDADSETLNSVFRAAHTLKALAGTVGHHRMAELTHTMETLFDTMRSQRTKPTQHVIDELLIAVDVLRSLKQEIITGEASDVDGMAILERLKALNGEDAADGASSGVGALRLFPAQVEEIEALRAAGHTIYLVKTQIDPTAFAPAARLSQAAMALMELGNVVAQQPTMMDLAQSNGQKFLHLLVLLATKSDAAAVEGTLDGVADLAGHTVESYEAALTSSQVLVETGIQQQEVKKVSPTGSPQTGDAGVDKTVRISIDRLDTLMNLVGELITDRNRLVQIDGTLSIDYGRNGALGALGEMSTHLGRVVDQLQEEVMRARMLPISNQFSKFPRIVRDVARVAGKNVNLVIEGEATELDRSLIEVIGDPLLHLLRNAVDHGVEKPETRIAAGKPAAGTVKVTAVHEEGHIVITVSDDGRGIDPDVLRRAAVARGLLSEEEVQSLDDDEAIELIFLPNLSTAQQVTSISGRGVGMDVVRNSIERLSGSVVVDSVLGEGTTFRVTLPLTLAIVDSMLVGVNGSAFAIPLAGIIDSLYLADVSIKTIRQKPAIRWRETVLPLLDLRQFFAQSAKYGKDDAITHPAIVTVGWGKQKTGLIVDRIIGKQGIVVKSLSSIVGDVPGILGSAILGDGRVALVIDIPSLIGASFQTRR
jgi:two-component system, chemotaxis family, sensor kinase CheA